MLNKIIDFSINNKLIVGLFIIALIVFGAYEFKKLPIDAVPDITNNQVQVITLAPSLGATDIERLVTFPIELANNNISGLHEMRSFSRFGLSLVTIVFNDDVDIYWARQQVAERLQKVQSDIPKGVGDISMAPLTTGLGEIYQYVIRPKEGYEHKFSPMQLRTIQDWIVRRQLLGVKGVAEVSSFGGDLKQYEIAVEPNKLRSYDITINDVFKALENNNQNTGGAYIEKGPTVLYIRSEGLTGSIDDINKISIKSLQNGTPLLIKDVAQVKFGSATRYGAMCYNDEGEVAGGVVMMLKGANSSEVIIDVKKRIEQVKRSLPDGVIIEPFLDRTKMVNNAIGTVEQNLLEGALIVIFVLVLFLGNFRAGFLVASVIPLAMLFAIIMMNTFGVSGNLMSLGALDFGLIVDGAVIIVEAVMHQLTHNKKFNDVTRLNQKQMDAEVTYSARKMMNSAVFGQVIILVVYLPIFTLQGIEGKMFKPMAQTVAFALLGAFILSLTYIPMMSTLFLSKNVKHKKNISDKLMERLENFYRSALNKAIRIPKTIILITILLFSASVITLSNLGGEFIPTLEEGDFAVETRVLSGSNLKTTIENTQKAARILKQNFPEVIKIVTKIGSSEIPMDPMPMDAGDMIIVLKDKEEWVSARTFNELAEKMTSALKEVSGITVSFQFPVQMRFNELMTGAKQDIICKIFGENLDTLAAYAKKIGDISTSVEGTQDLFLEPVIGLPQLVIEYDRAAIAQFGLNITDINKIVNTALAGQRAGFVYEGEKRFDMVVRLDQGQRKNSSDVKNLLIPTPQGTQIPLYQLAKVELKSSPNQIQREDAKRRIVVGFNARGRDVQSIVEELQGKVDAKIKLPSGYYITYGGAFENLNAAKQRLGITLPVSLLLIFLLLFFSFNSVKQGLLIYSAIPLSAMGGIFALAIRGMPFSISAGVGFIALFGVAVLNGIVLIAEFNRLRNEGESDIHEIILKGTRLRLRPVLMTGFVASLGFLPMAVSNGAGAEVQRPLATVVIGGLLIATLLTLFVLPILYMLFEKRSDPKGTKPAIVTALMILLGVLQTHQTSAQSFISLNAALDTAFKNNLTLKNEKLRSEYQQKLIKTGADIPQTTFTGEYGQINSSYYDNRFGVIQNFNFPTVYSNQRSVLSEEWKGSILNVAVKQAELKRNVSQLFYAIVFLKKKEKLLLQSDSLFANFVKKAVLRFEKGESNVLEKITAESQQSQIRIQLKLLEQEIGLSLLQFQILLNSKIRYMPEENEKRPEANLKTDTSFAKQHPGLKFLQQQKQIAFSNTQLQRSKLLPDLSLIYNSMTMRGTGADNVLYTTSSRFQSAQIGVGIPLFFGAQKARISSAKSNQMIADMNYQIGLQSLQTDYMQSLTKYNNQLQILSYYENTALKNAAIIASTANKQFENGEINYLEWIMLTNQSISIKSAYIDAVRDINESIIKLNYLTTN